MVKNSTKQGQNATSHTGAAKTHTRDQILKLIKNHPVTGDSIKDFDTAFKFAAKCGHFGPGDWAIIRNELYKRFNAPKTELNQAYKEAKRKHDKKNAPDSETIINALKTRYDIKMNVLDDSLYINGERFNDGIRAEMITSGQDETGMGIARIENAIIAHAYNNQFNPITDFLESLPAWDKQERVEKLIKHLNLADEMENKIMLRWMLGVIGKAISQDQNFMPVIDGPQGTGKSYWTRWFNPIGLHVEGTFNPGSKDHMFRLCGNWTWELGELQAITRKADRESLKSAITQKHVTDRLPYGHVDITKPITVSFIGTINNTGAGFLNDPTGSRRYAVVRSSKIDRSYTSLDKTQIWAELWDKYTNGTRGELTEDEAAYRDKNNQQYEDVSAAAELFTAHFSLGIGANVTAPQGAKSEWSASEIVAHLQKKKGLGGIFAKNKADIEEYLRLVGIERERDFSRNGSSERAAPWIYKNIWSNDWNAPDPF